MGNFLDDGRGDGRLFNTVLHVCCTAFPLVSLLNYVPSVPNVPTCLRAKFSYVPTCHDMLRANVPTCLRAKFPYVPTCHDMLRANVPTCQISLRANVP